MEKIVTYSDKMEVLEAIVDSLVPGNYLHSLYSSILADVRYCMEEQQYYDEMERAEQERINEEAAMFDGSSYF